METSRTKQAYYNYERVILQAVAEVETALVAIANERDRHDKLKVSTAAARKAVSLVRDSYRNGLVGFQTVLEADRSLFLLDDELTVSSGQIARNHIALYRALGGGSEVDLSKK